MRHNLKHFSLAICFFTILAIGTTGLSASADTAPTSTNADVESSVESAIAATGEARVIVTIADHSVSELTSAKKRSELAVDQSEVANNADLDKKETTNYSRIPAVATTINSSQLDDLINDPNVESIRLQKFYKSSELQSSTFAPSVARPALSDAVALLDADDAWANGTPYTGSGKSVVIIDTGVESSHEFLAGSVITERCYAQGPNGNGGAGSCPNGLDAQTGTGAAAPCTSVSACSHGTHVAGIAAGRQGVSGAPTAGIAPQANVIAIQVFSTFTSDDIVTIHREGHPDVDVEVCVYSGTTSPCILTNDSDVLSALNYVLANRTNVASVNLSLGGGLYDEACDGESPSVTSVITQLRYLWGILTLAAAGNDHDSTKISWPACISSAVAVGATSKADTVVTSYSNSNELIDIWGPGGASVSGGAINSSVPVSLDIDGNPNGYATKIGTSMATPMITGAVAVLRQAYPSETANQILARLQESGVEITDSRNNVTRNRPSVMEAIGADSPLLTQLMRTSSNSTVYVVIGDSKYSVENSSLYQDLSPLGPLYYVDDSYLDGLVSGGPMSRVVGSTGSSNIYLINDGSRLTFSSCDLVEDFGYSCDDVVKISPSQLTEFPAGPSVKPLIKSTTGSLKYYVADGQRRQVASSSDIAGLGISSSYSSLKADFVVSIPAGDKLFGSGSLIRPSNSSSVYAVNEWSGTPSVYRVTSVSTASALGLSRKVSIVSSSQFSEYEIGAKLRSKIKCGSDSYVATLGLLHKISVSQYSDYGYTDNGFVDGGSICNRLEFSAKPMTNFIKYKTNTYYVENGTRKKLTTTAAFKARGGSSAKTVTVSRSYVKSIRYGGTISK